MNGTLIHFKVCPLRLHTVSPPFLPLPHSAYLISTLKTYLESREVAERREFYVSQENLNQLRWMNWRIVEPYNTWWIFWNVLLWESSNFDKIWCSTLSAILREIKIRRTCMILLHSATRRQWLSHWNMEKKQCA